MGTIIATHTTAHELVCERSGGCGIDPVTLTVTVVIGLILLVMWLIDRSHRAG
jgi:hypothetical protein